jgi:hypothetical protein
MTPTNTNPNTTNVSTNAKTLALTGDWALFGAVTLLLMWHNGYATYARVSEKFGWLVALGEALVTVVVVEATSGYFLHAQRHEENRIRRNIAAIGVVVPLVISGIINLNIDSALADLSSRVATMACACIVAAWHWFVVRESPLDALRAEIAAIAAKLQAVTRERDAALTQAAAAGAGSDRAAAIIRGLQDDIETLRREHNAALTAADARHRDDIERLTHQHNTALALAAANATANVTVNVAQATSAQPVSTNAQPLTLTEESLALTIAQRRANGEAVNSDILSALFGVSASRIRQTNAWRNREVTA